MGPERRIRAAEAQREQYDFIIVGGGSAGCALASRISADSSNRVLVLEAGRPDYRWDVFIHMPAALTMPIGSRFYDWRYESEPEPYMGGRRIYHDRGKVLGGSSSINGMIFQRGNPMDYQRWAADPGMSAWDYAHCLPYFKRMENCLAGGDEFRGTDGPLVLERGPATSPLFRAFFEAVQQAGYPLTDDLNGYRQEGFAAFDRNVHRGRRLSAARAYLHPVLSRPNLDVTTRAFVTKILFSGRRAVGVELRQRNGTVRTVNAGEIILSGGAINSPQLLQLSGVGSADHLSSLGIDVVADLPGVGENLQDHLEVYVHHRKPRRDRNDKVAPGHSRRGDFTGGRRPRAVGYWLHRGAVVQAVHAHQALARADRPHRIAGARAIQVADAAFRAFRAPGPYAPGGDAADDSEERPEGADESAVEPGDGNVKQHKREEDGPDQARAGIETAGPGPIPRRQVRDREDRQVEGAVHERDRVEQARLQRAEHHPADGKKGRREQGGKQAVLDCLRAVVPVRLDSPLQRPRPLGQPAYEMMNRAKRAHPSAEDAPQKDRERDGRESPEKAREERTRRERRAQRDQGIELEKPPYRPAAPLPQPGPDGCDDAQPDEQGEEEGLRDAPCGRDAHGFRRPAPARGPGAATRSPPCRAPSRRPGQDRAGRGRSFPGASPRRRPPPPGPWRRSACSSP